MRKLSTGEFAQQVGLSQIRIRELAREGRITYARKEGGR
jgi:DNA-binding transcriptional MerR regulator